MPLDPETEYGFAGPTFMHNEGANRFEMQVGGQLAHLDYTRSSKKIVFTHTEVPKEMEGQGVGGELAREGLDFARQSHLRVIPQCPFVAKYIERHPEYQELLSDTRTS